MENKCCSKCNQTKEITNFSNNKNKKDGRNNMCKMCFKIYYLNNKSKNNLKKDIKQIDVILITKKRKENKKLANKRYRENNKEKLKVNKRIYKQNRIENDNLFKLRIRISGNIISAFKRSKYTKSSKTELILGCSFEEFKQYIESLFEPWMSWDNYGNPKDGIFEINKTWDIDHIKPLSTAKTEEELLELNYYTNLQPLCSYINRFIKKGDI